MPGRKKAARKRTTSPPRARKGTKRSRSPQPDVIECPST
eukprot:gene7262-2690_t